MFFIATLYTGLVMKVDILIIRDRTISLRGEIWAHKTNLTPLFFYRSACTQPGVKTYISNSVHTTSLYKILYNK
jgi:hypothetical protein